MQPSNETSDIFEEALQEKKALVQSCQQDKQLATCSDCDRMFECDTRKAYVKAVYESMSKGQGGGFEF